MDREGRLEFGEKRLSRELYACLHAAEFPAQALLRLRAGLKSQPVAILDGPSQDQSVYAFNRLAAQRGVVHGLSRMEAESIAGVQLCFIDLNLPGFRVTVAIAYTQTTCSTEAMPTPQSSAENTMDKLCSLTWQAFTPTRPHKPGNKI
jgi:hypothetical protein